MSRKKIREYDAKKMLSTNLANYGYAGLQLEVALADETAVKDNFEKLAKENGWLKTKKLVVKPDQLIGKKGKHNLVLLNADFENAKSFIKENMGKTLEVQGVPGVLTHFILEPFVEHKDEYFFAILSKREEDVILFSEKGGVDVEEHWDKMVQIPVPIGTDIADIDMESALKSSSLPEDKKKKLISFAKALYKYSIDFGCTYMEMNPLAFDMEGELAPLGLVCELDDCEFFKCETKWNGLEFPEQFGRKKYPEEEFVTALDDKTGASLKLTVINPDGKIWLLVAGGGASVIYTDTVVDLGFGNELGNYGEYSGDPNEEETYQYSKTVLDLATRKNGKVLIIGGGVANFTNVANTFKGIIRALRESKEKLLKNKMHIYVRRGGPNFEEGLKMMKDLGKELGIPMEVYGPETHMTKVVGLAINYLRGG
ncbi:MAG: ATP citrate lyase citrate-binding domain-containing protein [Candidatus Micrarchaeota archaeon]